MTEAVKLRNWLKEHTLLLDGAMGTYYASLCKEETAVSEYANKTNPDLIKRIHKEYIAAGANLIKTNTFALGQLQPDMTEEQQKELLVKACRIAKEAIAEAYEEERKEPVFLAADFGPIPQYTDRTEEEMLLQYKKLCDWFLEEGLTVFWFETFAETTLLKQVVDYIRQNCADAWIAVGFCLNKNGYTMLGKRADRLFAEWEKNGQVDAVGFNCGIGSGHMKKIVENLPFCEKLPLFIAPNVGYPKLSGNAMAFLNNVEYFADNIVALAKKGVSILGACCGSTPAYIRCMAEKLGTVKKTVSEETVKSAQKSEIGITEEVEQEQTKVVQQTVTKKSIAGDLVQQIGQNDNLIQKEYKIEENKNTDTLSKSDKCKVQEITEPEEKNTSGKIQYVSFVEKLRSGQKVIAVELDPPYDADISKIMDCGKRLLPCGVDVVTFADSPMGRSRIDSVLMAAKMKQELGVDVMPHICCRDKNMIAMRSMLLGAHIHDIRNLLLVTGDPIPADCRKTTTSVFDYNSIRLMQYVRELNTEHFETDPFVYGGALNYAGVNVDAIVRRMQQKIEAGASYFMTQPIFAKEDRERVALLKERTGATILCGIMPPVSYKNAVFVKNEIAGIRIPDEIVARYDAGMSKEEAEWVGVELAKELMQDMNDFADGYYFMLPFNRVSIIEKLMK